MTYESQGIFAEGRGIAFDQEAGSCQTQSCKGERSKGRKTKTSVCECCGKQYEADLKAKGRFCGYDCFYRDKKSQMNSMAPCLSCHSLLGMTGAASGRMVNMCKVRICMYRKSLGLRTLKPSEANIKATIQARINKEANATWWGDHAASWMSEYKPKFFDWSQIWNKEHARRNFKIVGSYYKMSDEERANHNRKIWQKRKDRSANDEEYRKKRIKYSTAWKKLNPEKNRASINKSNKKRKANDPGFRVQCNLRNRLKDIMKKVRKGGSNNISSLIGCTTKQLSAHLESTFKRGMTWENYGTKWHVDHIIPCASFDHTDEKQRAQCWHWTNLRALDAQKNMDKSNTITEPQMSLLLCATH